MKNLSLRLRLTLVTMLVLTLMAVFLTLASIYNAGSAFENIQRAYDAGDTTEELIDIADNGANPTSYAGEAETQQFSKTSLLLMLGIILLGGAAAYWTLGYALRPLGELSRRIGSLSEHELDSRITDFQAGDEISQLADSFNRLLARLQTAFETQKRFSSAAAHELRTPLAIIKTNLDVLHLLPEPQQADYETLATVAEDQTTRMIHLVDDLFAMSASQSYDAHDQLCLERTIQEILEELAPAADEKNLAVTLDADCPEPVICNAEMLRRAFSNLLENAVKYNVMGGRIDITIWEEGHRSLVRINDTGIGIPREQAERIFEPFYRVDTSRSRKIGGAGLGLAIARDTFRRHGGEVSCTAQEGVGCSFTVSLPRLPAASNPASIA